MLKRCGHLVGLRRLPGGAEAVDFPLDAIEPGSDLLRGWGERVVLRRRRGRGAGAERTVIRPKAAVTTGVV
jgi:hypothetical protein